jgi:Fe-S oxidoreductase
MSPPRKRGGPRAVPHPTPRSREGLVQRALPPRTVLLHAHCHQKALWGASSSANLLERCFPGRVRTLDTTCCGLAGGFGYTRDRFGLSMRIGELGVLPAARDAGGHDVLVAPGTSCRHQMKDGAGKRALHPVELVAGMNLRLVDVSGHSAGHGFIEERYSR